jgi:hypothetical protein
MASGTSSSDEDMSKEVSEDLSDLEARMKYAKVGVQDVVKGFDGRQEMPFKARPGVGREFNTMYDKQVLMFRAGKIRWNWSMQRSRRGCSFLAGVWREEERVEREVEAGDDGLIC